MKPLTGLTSLLESSKGNVFLLSAGALVHVRDQIPATLLGYGIITLGVAYMVTRAWTDAAAAKAGISPEVTP